MELAGRRIHIAGSAASEGELERIHYGQDLITYLVRALVAKGATVGVGVGKEPHVDNNPMAPALHFDWTTIASASKARLESKLATGISGRLVATVATNKTVHQIPPERQQLWDELCAADEIDISYVPDGWYSAAYRRKQLAQRCDAVVLLSGGEGVEHLAMEYAAQGKPVLPLDLDLGASSGDGSGGAARLARCMLETPEQFVQLRDPSVAGALLTRMSTREGAEPIDHVVHATMELLRAVVSPTAFFVRLLNPKVDDYPAVTRFFDQVVTPVVQQAGYDIRVMGSSPNNEAWMNQEIFDWLSGSQLIVVDYTGLRPSCFIEMGYALRGHATVLVTARHGTAPVFDSDAFEQYRWDDTVPDEQRRDELVRHWQRNLRRPQLVIPRRVL